MPGFEAAAQRTDQAALREQERALQRVSLTLSYIAKLFSLGQVNAFKRGFHSLQVSRKIFQN